MVVCLLFAAIPAFAQTAAPSGRKPEVDVALVWTGGHDLGSASATLTDPNGGPFVLFSTHNDVTASVGPEVHLAVRLTRWLRAEATGEWSRASLRSQISGGDDKEEATTATSTLRVSFVTAGGAAVWYFPRVGHLEPFLRGGVAWMRELTGDNVLHVDGTVVSAGGGMKYWWRERDHGFLKRFGLRSELRAVSRPAGFSLGDTNRRTTPAFSVGAMIGF